MKKYKYIYIEESSRIASNNADLQESKANTEAIINEPKVTSKAGLKIEIEDVENLDIAKEKEESTQEDIEKAMSEPSITNQGIIYLGKYEFGVTIFNKNMNRKLYTTNASIHIKPFLL